MKKLIKNISKIFTPNPKGTFGEIYEIDNPEILIEEGKIKSILNAQDQKTELNELEIIDAQGCCVLPGFIDPHTHPVFWQTREKEFIMRIQGKSYEEIAEAGGGIRNSARSFRESSKEQIKAVTKNRISKFFEYGTTTIEAKSGYGLSSADEIKSLEIINELNSELKLEMIPTFLGAHEVPDEYRNKRSEYIDLIINEMLPIVAEKKLAKYCDVFCEKGVFDLKETRQILEAAGKHGLKFRIHADELNAFGAAELAAEMKAVTADHLVKVSDEGIKHMAQNGVIPVLLPATTFFLRKDEYTPARKMLDAGCNIALATDFNPGSSMTQNMQMVWTIGALKLGLLPNELLWATTLIPARSLDIDKRVGIIEAGKQADLILLDIPNLEYLPYHFAINHVKLTIKFGEIVFSRFS
jgi:imidazolonepropionase